jgi:hypothetical protein
VTPTTATTDSPASDMKITQSSASKKRRIRPKAMIDFGAFDFAEFAAFLNAHAAEWLRTQNRPSRKHKSGER